MSGLYIHIPFCRQACSYCDFYFSVSLAKKAQMLEAIKKEISFKGNVLKKLDTIYLGGGTPSLLNEIELQDLLDTVHQNFLVSPKAEVTIETNPDDITLPYANHLARLGFNRVSIGHTEF
ncbi:MAG: radical SAM protein [Bacteroidales bacterium]|nr:radical SAM protein [Bacteroidales bacterium]